MIRRGRYKYIHYVGYAPMLFDLGSDPHERVDLSSHAEFRDTLAACEAQLRAAVDIDAVERLARADQRSMIERLGGKEAILRRGAVRHSPPPGVTATRIPVERG
jgi:choline-sulfatase